MRVGIGYDIHRLAPGRRCVIGGVEIPYPRGPQAHSDYHVEQDVNLLMQSFVTEAEKEFQEGRLRGLICTSSLELGIDIGSVDFIIQYTSPRETTRLVQRIGRSGHTLGGTSRGIILTTSPDDILESAVLISRAKQGRLERPIIHEKALDVLAHQIIGILLQERRMTAEQILHLVQRSYPFRELQPEELDDVIHQLDELRLIRKFGDTFSPRNPKAIQYYFENLSVIPDVQKYTVFDFFRKRRIGTLDQDFVARRCVSGAEFILHGQTWRVISVDEEKLHVEVEAAPPSLTAIPGWEGDMIPVQMDVASEVGRMRRTLALSGELDGVLEEPEREKASATLALQAKQAKIPSDKLVLVEGFENSVIVHTCAGNLVNEALANAMAALFGSRLGSNIATQVDQYRFALIFPRPVSAYMVAEEFGKLTPNDLETMINDTVEHSDLFAWKHWHVLRRIGAVSRDAEYKARQARLLVEIFKNSIANRETRRELFAEKLDIEGAKKLLSMIGSGDVLLEAVQDAGQCTPLALPLLDRIVPHGLLRPAVEETSIIEVIKSRLLSTKLRLLCINCGKWDGIRTVDDLQEQIRCPKCRSTLIAAKARSVMNTSGTSRASAGSSPSSTCCAHKKWAMFCGARRHSHRYPCPSSIRRLRPRRPFLTHSRSAVLYPAAFQSTIGTLPPARCSAACRWTRSPGPSAEHRPRTARLALRCACAITMKGLPALAAAFRSWSRLRHRWS